MFHFVFRLGWRLSWGVQILCVFDSDGDGLVVVCGWMQTVVVAVLVVSVGWGGFQNEDGFCVGFAGAVWWWRWQVRGCDERGWSLFGWWTEQRERGNREAFRAGRPWLRWVGHNDDLTVIFLGFSAVWRVYGFEASWGLLHPKIFPIIFY